MTLLIGWGLLALGGLVCVVNFHTSWLRYPLHRLRGGTKDDFHWVSGFPFVGSLFVALAWVLLVGVESLDSSAFDTACLVLVAIDTGGVHWMLLSGAIGAVMGDAAGERDA